MAANPRALPFVLLLIATSLVLLWWFVLRSDSHNVDSLSVTRALLMCNAFEPAMWIDAGALNN
jgi:hypothetical protein